MAPGDEANCFACMSGDPCSDHPRVTKPEAVNHPSHYGGEDNPYEHVKVMEAWGLVENAFLYQATKYICRAGKKSGTSILQDLQKAAWYINRAVEYERNKQP